MFYMRVLLIIYKLSITILSSYYPTLQSILLITNNRKMSTSDSTCTDVIFAGVKETGRLNARVDFLHSRCDTSPAVQSFELEHEEHREEMATMLHAHYKSLEHKALSSTRWAIVTPETFYDHDHRSSYTVPSYRIECKNANITKVLKRLNLTISEAEVRFNRYEESELYILLTNALFNEQIAPTIPDEYRKFDSLFERAYYLLIHQYPVVITSPYSKITTTVYFRDREEFCTKEGIYFDVSLTNDCSMTVQLSTRLEPPVSPSAFALDESLL